MKGRLANRTGTYVQQPEGYKAFIPKGLPPQPPIKMDQEMWMLLSQADRALGRLDGSTDTLPNPDLFVFMYVRKEAVLSSQIEGTQASLLDLLEFEAHPLERRRIKDVYEVANYVNAMNFGLERLKELPLSLRLCREIHAKLLEGVRGSERRPGKFREKQNWIGAPGINGLNNAQFVLSPPHAMGDALDNLEKFFYDPEPMPILIKVGLIHAQFETIHPFMDGNGRFGRLLITFLLCQKKILQHPLLYLSYYFKKYRSEYYDRLQSTRDKGDLESWLKFFLQGVYEVAQEATNTARNIVKLRENHRDLIQKELRQSAGKGLQILENLFYMPIISVEEVIKATELTYSNANRLVKLMCDIGLLTEITGQRRNRLFSYSTYLDIFKDPEDEV